ncbi:Uncharacterized [Moorella glycerini]|uniref:ATP synthase I chain n=1 Tax=Neomoorella stamsii TaxID=1266720 RepID=A0A9X7P517_9FIRM|nr:MULTISPECIES: hypothetical protein [Moorella]PRR70016.1 hypothetical protein MOST_28930 [Moorella stamsii]CEP68433.1 Uncharacterized [Moorella glycerini]
MIKIKLTRTEKGMLVMAALGAVAGLGGGYYSFVAGLGFALPVSLLLLRWQVAAVDNLDNLPPQKAFNRFFGRSLMRSGLSLALLGLALAGGIEFLFGVLAGLVLQVLAYMGKAILIILGKEG